MLEPAYVRQMPTAIALAQCVQDLVHLPCLRLWQQQLDRVVAANLEKDAATFVSCAQAGEPQPGPTFLGRQALDNPIIVFC